MENGLMKIGKRELRELLTKGWMTHDAMWFMHSIREFGIEKTNKINLAAIESMSIIEIKRIKKALGYTDKDLTSFERLMDFTKEAFSLVKADFMQFQFDAPEKNILSWKWMDGKCFAYEGVSALGCIEDYRCGIMKRIEGWFNGLGITYRIEPSVNRCLMHLEGKCAGRFVFELN